MVLLSTMRLVLQSISALGPYSRNTIVALAASGAPERRFVRVAESFKTQLIVVPIEGFALLSSLVTVQVFVSPTLIEPVQPAEKLEAYPLGLTSVTLYVP